MEDFNIGQEQITSLEEMYQKLKKFNEEGKASGKILDDFNNRIDLVRETYDKLSDSCKDFHDSVQSSTNKDLTEDEIKKAIELYKENEKLTKQYKTREDLLNAINKKLKQSNLTQEEINNFTEQQKELSKLLVETELKKNDLQKEYLDLVGQQIQDNETLLGQMSDQTDELNRQTKTASTNFNRIQSSILQSDRNTSKWWGRIKGVGSTIGGIVQTIGNIPGTVGNIVNETKNLAKPWLDADHAIHQMVKTFGLHGNQFEVYKKNMYDTSVTMAKWGKNMQDLVKTQQQYNQATGRNVQLSENAFNEQYKLNQVIGEEDGSQLTANLELFGQSVETSVDLYEDMYKTALKMGISITKSTKDMLKNLKLAQKYNFNGGLKNMMEMTVWANKTRFNMDSLGSIIDKFSDNFEDTISSAAQIQNLGGNFAMGADPLGMFYESLADPDALAKRLNGMLKGMGSFDTKTGETKFNINEAMLMRQFAKASGQSVEDVRAQAMEGRKRDYIQNNLINNTSGLTQEQIDLIGSKAQAKGNGEFVVTDNAGREINVRDINSSNIDNISTDTSEKDFLNTIAEQSRSANDKMDAIRATIESQQAKTIEELAGGAIHNTLNTIFDFIQANPWVSQAALGMDAISTIINILSSIVNMFKPMMSLIKKLGGLIGKGVKGVAKGVKNVTGKAWNGIKGGAKGIWNGIKGGAKNLWNGGKGLLKGAGKAIGKRLPVLGALAFGAYDSYDAYIQNSDEKKKVDELKNAGLISEEQYQKEIERLRKNAFNKQVEVWSGTGGSILGATLGGTVGSAVGPAGTIGGAVAGAYGGERGAKALANWITGGQTQSDLDINALYQQLKENKQPVVVSNEELGITRFDDGVKTPQIIQAATNDNILFAKDGGPFDSLFNDVFKRIDDVHRIIAAPENEQIINNLKPITISNAVIPSDSRNDSHNIVNRNDISRAIQNVSTLNGDTIHTNNENVLNRIKTISNAVIPSDSRNDSHILSVQPVGNGNGITSNGITDNVSNDISRINNASNNSINNNKISFEPLKIELSGNLTLSSENQTVDLTSIIRDNPMFIRQLSQMLSEEIGNRINGGRSLMNKSYV